MPAKIPLQTGLRFSFDGEGQWEAASRFHDSGIPFNYMIQVCDDGTFDVSQTDSELLGGTEKRECFRSLDAAKDWCEANEVVVNFKLEEGNAVKLFCVMFDSDNDHVEAESFAEAVAKWKAAMKAEHGDDWDGNEEPESVSLVSEKPVIR